MPLLQKNHLRYSLGHVTGFVQIGAAGQRRLRCIQAQVVIKAMLFVTAMYLILEAINYYYYFIIVQSKPDEIHSNTYLSKHYFPIRLFIFQE